MFDLGAIVEVYEDPLTMTRKEGNAEIVEHLYEIEPGLDKYQVHFIGDDKSIIVSRVIAEAPLCIGTDSNHCDNPKCRVHWVKGGVG